MMYIIIVSCLDKLPLGVLYLTLISALGGGGGGHYTTINCNWFVSHSTLIDVTLPVFMYSI